MKYCFMYIKYWSQRRYYINLSIYHSYKPLATIISCIPAPNAQGLRKIQLRIMRYKRMAVPGDEFRLYERRAIITRYTTWKRCRNKCPRNGRR